jgi:hypothetical protein
MTPLRARVSALARLDCRNYCHQIQMQIQMMEIESSFSYLYLKDYSRDA